MAGANQVYHLRSGVWQRYTVAGGGGGPQLWVGATVTDYNASNAISNFLESTSIMGPLRLRRTYVSQKTVGTFPTDVSQTDVADDITAGIHSFLSVKGDPTGIANGDYDGVIAQLVQTFPSDRQCWYTMWHEPEDDMTGAQFVAMFQRMYTVAKAANPALLIGPVHMSYQWRPGNAATAVPDDWWVGSSYCDFIGVDTYWHSSRGPVPEPLENDPQHRRWHDWAVTKGKPLYVVERGVMPIGPVSASITLQDEIWLKANGYEMFMYWDAIGTGGKDWIIRYDPDASSAWQQIASRGRSV